MLIDPIVEEVRKYRKEYVAQFNFNLDTIINDLKAKESQSGLNYEKRVPKPYCLKSMEPMGSDSIGFN